MSKNIDSIGEKPNQYKFSEEEKKFLVRHSDDGKKRKAQAKAAKAEAKAARKAAKLAAKLAAKTAKAAKKPAIAGTPATPTPVGAATKPANLALSQFNQELKKLKYLRHVPKVLTSYERLVIKFLFAVMVVAGVFLSVQFYLNHTKLVAKAGGTYTEGMVGEPKYINPVLADASDIDRSIVPFVFRGLMRFDKNLQLQPDIADSYEKSADGKTYTFHLRKDAKWHDFAKQDGIDKIVSADDVVFTIQTIQNKEFGSPIRANFDGVTVEKVDDFTVKFTLENSFTPFLNNTTVGILPKHIWENIPATNIGLAEVNLKPIGSGPYRFKSFEKDKKGVLQSYTLERFKDYTSTKPYIDRVIFHFYQNSDALVDAYKKKDISAVNFLLPEQKESIQSKRPINVIPMRLSLYHAVFFNSFGAKALDDKQVRLALATAVDKERIIREALGGQGVTADGPILQGFLGFNPQLTKIAFDQKRAEDILDKAGWRDTNHNDVRDKDGTELEFTVRTTDFAEHQKTADILKEEWAKIGVKLTVESTDATDLQQTIIRPRNYSMLLFGEIVGHDPDPYVYWHSSQVKDPGLNLTSFKNKSVDNLLDEARKTDDATQRNLKYLDFQNRIADDIPAIFLYSPTYSFGVSRDVLGVGATIITNPSERYLDFEGWYIKTNRVWK